MKTRRAPRKLHAGHFAFFRAVVQGLDARASWERYLATEQERVDERRIRNAIAAMRADFAAAAKREKKPGTARLVLIETELHDSLQVPTLEEFAAHRGMEDFSQAEQEEAYAEEFGDTVRRGSRRARLIGHQLEALRWLETLMAEKPRAGDGVGAWLAPALADRIERAGMPTLFSLIERINGVGQRWWTGVPGIGQLKAARIVEWLQLHEASIGFPIGSHALRKKSELQPQALAAVVPQATALVPLEKFLMPSELDGSAGKFRAAGDSPLGVDNDLAAVRAWLVVKSTSEGTERSYRKEAERLVLWSILERKKPLSSLDVRDATAYVEFLKAPPSTWCGPRHRNRWSPLWRPLEGPLSAPALRQAVTILRSLYAFLVQQHYLVGNPFSAIAAPRESGRALGSSKTLSYAVLDTVAKHLEADRFTAAGRRRGRAVRWLYATGLRLSEMAAARCRDLERIELPEQAAPGWLLSVLGKGRKWRKVPVPPLLVAELCAELARAGRPADPLAEQNAPIPILADFSEPLEPWSESGLYKALKSLFSICAAQLQGHEAEQLRKASPHWLRHSHGSHALNGRPGHPPVPVQVVQNNLGHASIGTTSGYLQTEEKERLKAMANFWGS